MTKQPKQHGEQGSEPEHEEPQTPVGSVGPEAARVAAANRHVAQQPGSAADALEAHLNALREAANAASAHARNGYLTFLLVGLYLAIIFGSTTHEQLLRESPVTLPVLNVGLPLVGFYWVVPALFVLLHLSLLVQLYLLADALHRLDRALREADDPARADAQRSQIHPFPFSHMLIGRQHGRLMRFLLSLMVWLTVLVLPVVLLLAGQVRFLPYHDAWATMWHRVLVFVDLVLVLVFWRPIRHPEDRLRLRPGRWFWHQGKMLPGILVALALSFLVFTFPAGPETLDAGSGSVSSEGERERGWGDPMAEWLLALAPESLIDRSGPQPMLWPKRWLFDRLPFLERNLVVREANLVGSWPTQAQIEQFGEDLAWQNFGAPPSLRGRDLRYADLSRSICVRGDFRGANLQGAVLFGANLQGADLRDAALWGVFLDDNEDLSQRWRLAGLRGADVKPLTKVGAWIEQETQGIAEEDTRNRVAERLRAALRDDDRPALPHFPEAWRSAPTVMFDLDDALPRRLGWGKRPWKTVEEYDKDLAAFLGNFACGTMAPVAHGLAWRALVTDRNEPDRRFPARLAARLTGDDCPPAAGLPDEQRKELEKRAATK